KRRFMQEAQAASALNHPNIITIHDIALQNGCAFQVMEFVQGQTLAELIRPGGMPVQDVVNIAVQMAEALIVAHATGIIHRDLKPGNVIVSSNGRVKLLDFGLAKLAAWGTTESDATRTPAAGPQTEQGTIIGTVCYMSPEQANGTFVDARADIFSFGALLFEMLSGRRAFPGETVVAMLSGVLRDDPPPLSTLVSGIPSDIEFVVQRCLRKKPDDRFARVAELLPYLQAHRPQPPSSAIVTGSLEIKRAEPVIAVLPFMSMSPELDNQCFADGLAEEIMHQLARQSCVRVLSRTVASVNRGEGADLVLEGSVRRSAERIRVNVQLFDPKDGCALWSERFERTAGDTLALQDELAALIWREVIACSEPARQRLRLPQ
ncbi:MAG TPA: serine/threonine-protein kinase, partial [Bryobacteraceae bacterium]|nr:serine/threonine-protein kinase [Bryobacteraceae bacterium]